MGEFLNDPVQFLAQRPMVAWQVLAGVTCGMMSFLFGRWMLTPKPEPPPPSSDVLSWSTVAAQYRSSRRPKQERRSYFRRSGRLVHVEIYAADDIVKIGDATVIDRSYGGVGLQFNAAIAVKTEIHIRPENLTKGLPNIIAEVRACKQLPDGTFHIGCMYRERPTWNVAMHLG